MREWTYFLKFLHADDLIIFACFLNRFCRSGGIADLFLENSIVLLEDLLNKSILSNSRWAYQNEWLSSEWGRVEWMEVFFGVNINIVLQKLQI